MLHVFAAFVHGVLAFGHVLGVLYNAGKGQYGRAALHAGAGVFSAHAAYQHSKEVD